MKFLKLLLLSVIALPILLSCNGNDPTPSGKTFEIYLDFWNTTGKTPEIRFDETRTSREIKIDFSKTFGGYAEGNSLTKVVIDNFRIIDANSNNYNIDKITAYEYRADSQNWKEDVEFTMEFGQSDDISVVLVLDRSESLGADFANVKTYANDFIDKIFSERKNAKMGIVDFADDIKSYPLTTNSTELKSYISNLNQGKFTTLYDAMNKGIDMLQADNAQSKVIIVFTDGTDNNSFTTNPDGLVNRLKGDSNQYKISSFTIGLDGKGGVDKTVLTKLAVNGGVAEFPKDAAALKEVFNKFSKVISNVYNLTYIRNQQKIDRATPVKLKFVIQTTQ